MSDVMLTVEELAHAFKLFEPFMSFDKYALLDEALDQEIDLAKVAIVAKELDLSRDEALLVKVVEHIQFHGDKVEERPVSQWVTVPIAETPAEDSAKKPSNFSFVNLTTGTSQVTLAPVINTNINCVTLGKTQNSGSPFWRCMTDDNLKFNIFKHTDPKRDSYRLFSKNVQDFLDAVPEDGMSFCMINVDVVKEGEWYKVVAHHERETETLEAKKPYQMWDDAEANPDDYVFVDCETTGIDTTVDRIIQICVMNALGKVLFSSYIDPHVILEAEVTELTGITAEMLEDAPEFEDIAHELCELLDGKHIIGYNVGFDIGMINMEYGRLHRNPFHDPRYPAPNYKSTYDVMKQASIMIGEKNDYGQFKYHKLLVAALRLNPKGITGGEGGDYIVTLNEGSDRESKVTIKPHSAESDCHLTRFVLYSLTMVEIPF